MGEDIVGIDLGTTNSLIGVVEAGFPILLADAAGSRLTPSVVYYPPGGGAPEVGAAAQRRQVAAPGRTVTSVKRLMGRRPGNSSTFRRMRWGAMRPGRHPWRWMDGSFRPWRFLRRFCGI